MSGDEIRWGLTATIKAPAAEILRFAAWHLEQGAHRLDIFLDERNPQAFARLKPHPNIRVTVCDDAHWQRLGGKRPEKHQVRQAKNATYSYGRRKDLEWLAHVDVDEFLWPDGRIGDHLAALPAEALTARLRPAEALAGSRGFYKAFLPSSPERPIIVGRLYPTFGDYLRGGFVSHTAGKAFVRTGLGDMKIRIHNVVQGDSMNPGQTELPGVALLHRHAADWDDWIRQYTYRLAQGSYRPDLPPSRPSERGGMNLNTIFTWLEQSEGEAGLRAFFDEVMSDSAGLPDRLQGEGLLRQHDLPLDTLVKKHFDV